MKNLYCSLMIGFFAAASMAATHSAWSDTIPWDATITVQVPAKAPLSQARIGFTVSPNPVSVAGAILITLDRSSGGNAERSLAIIDFTGKTIRQFNAAELRSGHPILWNCLDDKGNLLSAGIYLLVFKAQGVAVEKRLVILNQGGAR